MTSGPQPGRVPYIRDALVNVLVYHYRKDIKGCGCGWAALGASHSEHVADVYEESVTAMQISLSEGSV